MVFDASGSMEVYSRYLINFVRGVIGRWLHADPSCFIRGWCISPMRCASDTRIATALKTFNDRYAKETLHRRAVVIVMSDGYDTDSPEALAVEPRRLKRRAHRLVWLNPLLGWKGYAPVARAMAVALDYVDCFATAHSLASLAALEGELARL